MMSFLLEKFLWKGSCSHSQAQFFGSIFFTLYFLKAFTPQNQKKEWLYFSIFYVSFIFWQVFLQTSHAEGGSKLLGVVKSLKLSFAVVQTAWLREHSKMKTTLIVQKCFPAAFSQILNYSHVPRDFDSWLTNKGSRVKDFIHKKGEKAGVPQTNFDNDDFKIMQKLWI